MYPTIQSSRLGSKQVLPVSSFAEHALAAAHPYSKEYQKAHDTVNSLSILIIWLLFT